MLDGLLGGVEISRFPQGLDTPIAPLSGGERRRIALAQTLLGHPELLLLDEPTNHLDVEGVDWLARHLAARRGSMLVVTHDRWFLDAVCTHTWEVADGAVHQYEGGYAAYVLARAERERQAAAREERRQQLLRKELAWLRRGPPARTSKPKFRIEAANALIADEPEVARPRRAAALRRLAARARRCSTPSTSRSPSATKTLLRDVDLAPRPGRPLRAGRRQRLRQDVADEAARGRARADHRRRRARRDGQARVPLARTRPRSPATCACSRRSRRSAGARALGDGRELTAGQLLRALRLRRREAAARSCSDLSGGERRRLQLMRLLMGEPNVLLLDEPTNDLDIDTLTALEDLLDSWPGTLVVVSHDRYFVERVCDNVYALTGDGKIRHLPGRHRAVPRRCAGRTRPSRVEAGGEGGPQPGRRPRGPQGGRAPRARAREAQGARDRTARGDGRGRHRPRPPARAPGRAGGERRRAGPLEQEWLEAAEQAG